MCPGGGAAILLILYRYTGTRDESPGVHTSGRGAPAASRLPSGSPPSCLPARVLPRELGFTTILQIATTAARHDSRANYPGVATSTSTSTTWTLTIMITSANTVTQSRAP